MKGKSVSEIRFTQVTRCNPKMVANSRFWCPMTCILSDYSKKKRIPKNYSDIFSALSVVFSFLSVLESKLTYLQMKYLDSPENKYLLNTVLYQETFTKENIWYQFWKRRALEVLIAILKVNRDHYMVAKRHIIIFVTFFAHMRTKRCVITCVIKRKWI